jgi:hypothetical protein
VEELSGIAVILDVDLDEGAWRWVEDFKSERKILIVPCEIFEMIEQGIIPDGIRKDIEKQSNGSSPI